MCYTITFEIDHIMDAFLSAGSAHAANLFSSTAKLSWLSGEDKAKTFNFRSEGHIKSFCTNCGSALPNLQFEGGLLVVPAGSIDSDINVKPQGHIYCANKANWDNDLEKVPKFEKLPI